MREIVEAYYGETLTCSADLQTNACCTDDDLPRHLKPLMAKIHPNIVNRYYGCGLIVPPLLTGLTVLDLGCGAGRDVYLLSQMVGKQGRVIGVDMTEAQLVIAKQYQSYHRDAFGYEESNVQFLHGDIERLDELDLADASIDVIISNCVINLALDKSAVLREAYRVLKPGGELYFADVYSDRRIPDALASDPVLYGECLGGALYWNDFLPLARQCGFIDPRLVNDRPITIGNTLLADKVGNIRFYSATYCLFKLTNLELACEDHGQSVVYRGSIPDYPHHVRLDKHHRIETGRQFPVCGNTFRMLHDTRFREHFDFYGGFDRHFGIFPGCGTGIPFDQENSDQPSSSCC